MTDQTKIRYIKTREQAKSWAKIIRADHADRGTPINHARSLELVAAELGFRDWNALNASLSDGGRVEFFVGDRVEGQYLKQEFRGSIVKVARASSNGDAHVSVELDEPVDVVRFDSFSALRKRVTGTLSAGGVSLRKTSDGVPHLILAKVETTLV